MKRILPYPAASVVLCLSWLLIRNTASFDTVVMGAVVGLIVPLLSARFLGLPEPIAPRTSVARLGLGPRVGTALHLFGVVLWDIVVANLQVARLILGRESKIHPVFIWVPLDITHPTGITLLATIITMTPGTISSDLSDDRKYLLVHALDAGDEPAVIASIKARYEAPLIRLFPC